MCHNNKVKNYIYIILVRSVNDYLFENDNRFIISNINLSTS